MSHPSEPYLLTSFHKETALPDKLVGDHVRLKQVLVNLTKNALKFASKKDVVIRAAFCPDKNDLLIQVSDQGRGLDPDEVKNLKRDLGVAATDPSFESSNLLIGDRDKDSALGLGLTICKHIVKKNGGYIDLYSEGLGQGTTLIFTMQMALAAADEDIGMEIPLQ